MNIEMAFSRVIEGVSNTFGEDFFLNITEALANAVQADFCFIGRVNKDFTKSKTIAVYGHGKHIKNFEYQLRGTPCEAVTSGGISVYPSDVASLFPDDIMLVEMGIEAYIGAALRNREGETLGLVAALFHNPLTKTESIKNIYDIFAGRISAEIDNTEKTAQLERLNASLEEKIASKTAELKTAKESAEEANRFKSEFLANVSHDLRSPMHAILSFSGLCLKRASDEKIVDYLNKIQLSGERLIQLLNDLLDLSKLESGKLTPEFIEDDLSSVVQQSIDELSSLISNKNLAVHTDFDNPAIAVFDKKLIAQVIVNLISNAIKFSPETSDLELTTTKHIDQDKLVFSVLDEGVGIPQEELENVFDKFVQSSKTKRDDGGTGLGLPISKEIIELHSGKIWAESPPAGKNKGTIFTFEIPIHQAGSNID